MKLRHHSEFTFPNNPTFKRSVIEEGMEMFDSLVRKRMDRTGEDRNDCASEVQRALEETTLRLHPSLAAYVEYCYLSAPHGALQVVLT